MPKQEERGNVQVLVMLEGILKASWFPPPPQHSANYPLPLVVSGSIQTPPSRRVPLHRKRSCLSRAGSHRNHSSCAIAPPADMLYEPENMGDLANSCSGFHMATKIAQFGFGAG